MTTTLAPAGDVRRPDIVDGNATNAAAITEASTIADAKAWLRDRVDSGETCPCCTQFAKVYKRKIHSTMARALIVAYRHAVREFAYLPDTLTHRQNADFAKLAHWGLIEAEESTTREDGSKRTGRWRVTELGEQWVLARAQVPKYVRIYDGRNLGFSGDPVGIRDALGARFDWNELMGSAAATPTGVPS